MVALRKESVDRNHSGDTEAEYMRVALRKESVDRNIMSGIQVSASAKSLSARRAWIEIMQKELTDAPVNVALRKESVDRNIGRR